jgi:hypothetical protein
MLLLAIADLNRRSGDGSLTLKARADGAWRVLHVAKSALIATESSVVAERLGNMLAAEGRLDPVLIEPVANEARKRGTLLGHQLVADGLLTPTDLASALERQGRLRMDNALATPGVVGIVPKGKIEPMVRTPLGASVIAAFRSRINLQSIQDLIAERPAQPIALDLQSEVFRNLELGPGELRICRSVAAGQSFDAVLAASPAPDAVIRILGALVALGLWA